MSKDRDSNDSASGSGLRFPRNQSPSTANRRSRDRERTTNDKTWERDADANTMLITNEANIASPAVAGTIGPTASTTVTAPAGIEQSDHPMDDSRLSGKNEHFVINFRHEAVLKRWLSVFLLFSCRTIRRVGLPIIRIR